MKHTLKTSTSLYEIELLNKFTVSFDPLNKPNENGAMVTVRFKFVNDDDLLDLGTIINDTIQGGLTVNLIDTDTIFYVDLQPKRISYHNSEHITGVDVLGLPTKAGFKNK